MDEKQFSSLGNLYSKDTFFQGTQNLVPEKMFTDKSLYLLPLFRDTSIGGEGGGGGKGHSFRFPYPGFNLSSGDTLALKKVTNYKKKNVDTFMCTLVKMTTTFTTLTISFKSLYSTCAGNHDFFMHYIPA